MTGKDRLQAERVRIYEKFLAQFPETMRKYYKKLAHRLTKITYNPQDQTLGVNAAARRLRQIKAGTLRKENGLV